MFNYHVWMYLAVTALHNPLNYDGLNVENKCDNVILIIIICYFNR